MCFSTTVQCLCLTMQSRQTQLPLNCSYRPNHVTPSADPHAIENGQLTCPLWSRFWENPPTFPVTTVCFQLSSGRAVILNLCPLLSINTCYATDKSRPCFSPSPETIRQRCVCHCSHTLAWDRGPRKFTIELTFPIGDHKIWSDLKWNSLETDLIYY